VLIMDVVRQVVKAAQDNIDSERALSSGYFVRQSSSNSSNSGHSSYLKVLFQLMTVVLLA